MTLSQLQQWFDSFSYNHLILGYGSLINRDSRQRFSDLTHTGLLVEVNGFARGWITRSIREQQTYVGAWPEHSGRLNALMVPTALSPALARREKDYRFVQVQPQYIDAGLDIQSSQFLQDRLAHKQVWICQSLATQLADAHYPVSQTYIDTCLAGCLEHGGQASAQAFIRSTAHWPEHIRQDRTQPAYSRPGRVSPHQQRQIDALLLQEQA